MTVSIREETLKKAIEAVCKDRQETYGPIEDSFSEIGGLWSEYLRIKLTNNQVAMMMVLLKVARSKHKVDYMDNYVDIAGYAACAAEMSYKSKTADSSSSVKAERSFGGSNLIVD